MVLHSSHMEDTDATDGRRYPFRHLSNLGANGSSSASAMVCIATDSCLATSFVMGLFPPTLCLVTLLLVKVSFLSRFSAKKKAAAQIFDRGRYASVGKIAESILGRVGQLIGSCMGFQGSQKSPSLGCPWLECLVLLDYCMGKIAPQRFDGSLKVSTTEFCTNLVPSYPCHHACFDPGGGTGF